MATKKQVEAKLRELIDRLDEAPDDLHGTLADALPERRTLEVHVGDLDERFWTEMSGGRFGELHRGAPGNGTDILVRLDSDDLVDLVDGRANLFNKYLAGHVRIDASLSDLMRLRKLIG